MAAKKSVLSAPGKLDLGHASIPPSPSRVSSVAYDDEKNELRVTFGAEETKGLGDLTITLHDCRTSCCEIWGMYVWTRSNEANITRFTEGFTSKWATPELLRPFAGARLVRMRYDSHNPIARLILCSRAEEDHKGALNPYCYCCVALEFDNGDTITVLGHNNDNGYYPHEMTIVSPWGELEETLGGDVYA